MQPWAWPSCEPVSLQALRRRLPVALLGARAEGNLCYTRVAEDQARYERELDAYQKAQADTESHGADTSSRGPPASRVGTACEKPVSPCVVHYHC